MENTKQARYSPVASRHYREQEGVCFVEGIRPALDAIESGARLEALLIAPEVLRSEVALRMAREQEATGVPVIELSRASFERLSDRENPTGLAALVYWKLLPLEELPLRQDALLVNEGEGLRPETLASADVIARIPMWSTASSQKAVAAVLKVLYLGVPRLHLPELSAPPRAQAAAALADASLGEVVALVPAGASPQTGAAVYIALGQPPDAEACLRCCQQLRRLWRYSFPSLFIDRTCVLTVSSLEPQQALLRAGGRVSLLRKEGITGRNCPYRVVVLLNSISVFL